MFTALFNAFDFKGRANRGEYWSFVLFAFVLQLAASGILALTHIGRAVSTAVPAREVDAVITLGLSLFLLIPALSVTVRRLHDIGRSGWWTLLNLPLTIVMTGMTLIGGMAPVFMAVAAICAVVQIIFMLLPGTDGPNRYDTAHRELKRVRLGDSLDEASEAAAARRSTIAFSPDAAAILWPARTVQDETRPPFGHRG